MIYRHTSAIRTLFLWCFLIGGSACLRLQAAPAQAAEKNLMPGAKITATSSQEKFKVEHVTDGLVSDGSRWLAANDDPSPVLEFSWATPVNLAVVDVFSGWKETDPVPAFALGIHTGGKWVSNPAWTFERNQNQAVRVTIEHEADRLRLRVLAGGKDLAGRIREVAAYATTFPPVGTGLEFPDSPGMHIDLSQHVIALNQIGMEATRTKRFTAPITPDGTDFTVNRKGSETVLFKGKVQRNIGDFSGFVPGDGGEFVIRIEGGDLASHESDPFLLERNFYQDLYWQGALDFLIDTRSVLGTHPSAFGGCPWRDGTYYDAIVPSLVLFYMADPAWHRASKRQIDYQAEKIRVMDPAFPFDPGASGGGVLEATRAYFDLPAPAADAPDVVKLMHWGAGYYLCKPVTRDPSGDPIGAKVHAQTLEQIAYLVWLWPQIEQWIPRAFYERCRDLCFDQWEKSGALGIPEWWSMETYQKTPAEDLGRLHPFKGRHAPGHSIVPNLLMHEIAKREGRDDASRYLQAAVEQAAWIVKNIDWQDPRTTKGQRMSEHKTICSLVWLLQNYPQQAPDGLLEKIEAWAQVAVSRSNNLWDFRRFDMDENWTIPHLNDVGNWCGSPAIFTAVSWVVRSPALKQRLRELAVTHIDVVFGRNPILCAAPAKPEQGFTGIERGWPKHYHENVCARLETVRGSISSGPGTEMFPFNPSGKFRHPEGWVNYGSAWCISLAYLKWDDANQAPPKGF